MSFTTNDIEKIAHLSHLLMTPSQAQELADNFSKIIKLVEHMDACDTENITPLSHPLDTTQPIRPDIVTEDNQRERMQAIAPDTKAGLYIVPPFIETD